MNRQRLLMGIVFAVLLVAISGLTYAQEPGIEPGYQPQAVMGSTFSYQGRLEDGNGPINGTCDLTFELYDAPGSGNPPSGGTQLGMVNLSNKTIIDGYFTVQLDFGGAAFTGEARWLQISVDCGEGAVTLAPRQELTPSPYALYANRAGVDFAGSGMAETVSRSDHDHWGQIWSGSGTGLALYGGSYGLSATGEDFGVYGRNDSTSGVGMLGHATAASSNTIGVGGLSDSTEGRGVDGWASAKSGDTYGVYGHSESDSGTGVYGYAISSSGRNYGVMGETESSNGRGVAGIALADSGATFGVYGRSESTSGSGVAGHANAASGETNGVYGRSDSPEGRGVFGLGNYGVYGISDNINGRGVYGYATDNRSGSIGVYGITLSNYGYGGYFVGDVHVTGDLDSSGNKPFKIDHPLDPPNSYLYHFSQEAPQVQNVYNDVVTLDADGKAVVTLPDYFPALNTGPFLYQLTAIGGAMPNLHIAQEIEENAFAIAGGEPGLKVSWEVTAVRNDPYMRDNPVQSEQEKPDEEKGTYLYPQGYGQPQEMGLDYLRDQEILGR